MTDLEFIAIFSNNVLLYILYAIFNILFFYLLFRKKIYSIIDPLFYTLILAACANAVPMFLFHLKYISIALFSYFCFSELSFWMGFFILRSKGKKYFSTRRKIYKEGDLFKLFFCFFVFDVLITLFNYSTAGVPLFSESRFSGRQIPIVAFLQRIAVVPNAFCTLYSFHIFLSHNSKCVKTIVGIAFAILIVFSLLSGSKGFFLGYVFAYWAYVFIYQKQKVNISWKYIAIAFITPIPVIAIYYGNSDPVSSLGFVLFRFVAAGDGYWQGFTNGLIDSIDNTAHWYERCFSFILGPLGLISENAKIPLGTLILNQLNPDTIGLLEGANSRIPIFTWACFRWSGILASFIMGLLAKAIMYGRGLSITYDIVGLTIKFSMYNAALSIVTDPTLCFSGLIDIIFGILVLNMLSYSFFHKRGLVKVKSIF